MKYILFVMFIYGNPTATTAEFNTLPACEAAAKQAIENNKRFAAVRAWCAPKG